MLHYSERDLPKLRIDNFHLPVWSVVKVDKLWFRVLCGRGWIQCFPSCFFLNTVSFVNWREALLQAYCNTAVAQWAVQRRLLRSCCLSRSYAEADVSKICNQEIANKADAELYEAKYEAYGTTLIPKGFSVSKLNEVRQDIFKFFTGVMRDPINF